MDLRVSCVAHQSSISQYDSSIIIDYCTLRPPSSLLVFRDFIMAPRTVRIGVLALQGAFREHLNMLNLVPGVESAEVRTLEQLCSIDGLVIPGGESTTMALIAERWGLMPKLKELVREGLPIWGTCAGMILLADNLEGAHGLNTLPNWTEICLRSTLWKICFIGVMLGWMWEPCHRLDFCVVTLWLCCNSSLVLV